MKRLFLTVLGAMLLAVPAVQAQKVNREALTSAIEKSDAEIQDPKKAAKAATWIKRAQVYYAAQAAPTKDIFLPNMPSTLLQTTCGNPKSREIATIRTGEAEAYKYNYLTIYVQGDKVVGWIRDKQVAKNSFQNMMEALDKAYELDPKQAPKIETELVKIVDCYKQDGDAYYEAARFDRAAEAYCNAYKAQKHAAFGAPAQPLLLFNAGLILTIDGSQNPDSYKKGAQCLLEAVEDGYEDPDGSSYYYLFHCYYGQAQNAEGADREALLQKGKDALTEGIQKFPTNERIIESFLSLYMSEPTMGDPADLIGIIQSAIERDPQSVSMWSSLALANFKMKDYDAAISAGEKVVELAPDAFDSNYRLGIFCAAKGDAIVDKMNTSNYTRQSDYDADYAAASDAYRSAVPWLEKAHAIQIENKSLVETLKTIYFRLRDEEGMMDKYNEYNALLQQMQ